MSRSASKGSWKREVRTFAAGAGCGFLAGAFAICVIVWHYGNVIGSRAASLQYPPHAPSAVERWDDGLDDAGPGVLETADERPTATSGRARPPDSSVTGEPTIAAPPDSPRELADRNLEIPVEGVRPDQLTRQFSEIRGSHRHEAIDILAPRNTQVKAVEAGRIARLFYSKSGGITVYQFDPSERYCYYYAHLERYADGLHEGDRVKKGQVIGYVGTSGNAPKDTPHLHFAVFRLTAEKHWWEGTPIDPYEVLR